MVGGPPLVVFVPHKPASTKGRAPQYNADMWALAFSLTMTSWADSYQFNCTNCTATAKAKGSVLHYTQAQRPRDYTVRPRDYTVRPRDYTVRPRKV